MLIGLMAACGAEHRAAPPPRQPLALRHTECKPPPRPEAAIRLVPMFANLAIEAPVGLVQAPRSPDAATGRWFLLDQNGLVHSFVETDGRLAGEHRVTDLTDRVFTDPNWLGELGLLGIALHPDFASNGRVYLSYTARGESLELRLSSFGAKDGSLDPASEVILLSVPQPFANHKGGHLAFGPDGLLYLAIGDGGAAGDPFGNGQNKDTLLGAILRLDVDRKTRDLPYGIVADNPFARGGGRPEIYAYGLRNPWRFSFDAETKRLWSGDVGQDRWEEINLIERGGNYGWNLREGAQCFPPGTEACPTEQLEDPVYAYEHPRGEPRSITGGVVYRGSRLPALVGKFVFADYETGSISALELPRSAADAPTVSSLVRSGYQISAFAEDLENEVYALDYGGKRVLRLDPGARSGAALPQRISQTGCMQSDNPQRPAPGAIPYRIAVPFWSDGAEKQRYLFLPDGGKLSGLADGDLEVPEGSVLIKNFSHRGRLFETRFYVRHEDGEYSGFSYAWRSDGSDADLVEATHRARIDDLDWIYPGPEACNQCHTAAAGRTLGLSLDQLGEAQLDTLVASGALEPPRDSAHVWSTSAPLDTQARAYLHVNCSSCHQPGGPGRGRLDLRFSTPLARTGLCQPGTIAPEQGALLVARSGARSPLVMKIGFRGRGSMPPLATLHVDVRGRDLVQRWADSLERCD